MCLFKSKRRTRMVKCTSRLTTPVSHCNVSRIIPSIIYSLTVHKYPLITRRRVIKYLNESMIALKIIKANWNHIEERKRRKGRKTQREPLFLRFLVRKQCLVWRLVQQRDIGLPSYLRLVTANTFRSSRVSISGLSFIRSLSTRTRDFIPEIFQTENYRQDWWINERKYFLRNVINQTSQC